MKHLLMIIGCIFNFVSFSHADQPHEWQVGLQQPATDTMASLVSLIGWKHDVMIALVVSILAMIAYICIRYSKKNNPVASKTSHHTGLEIAWTIVPVLIIIAILVPSIKLLYKIDTVPDCEMTIKIVGHQWYWEYQYPDHGSFGFDSMIIPTEKLAPDQLRLYTVDNKLVLPVNTNIKVLITSADVIHSWGVPSFGVKKDAVPGRVNEVWLNINSPGVYYGHCYELCGINHGFMPINVEAKSKEDFIAWANDAQKKFSSIGNKKSSLLALQ